MQLQRTVHEPELHSKTFSNRGECSILGHTVTVTTSIGLKLVWDGKSYVEVIVTPDYHHQLCGLCGNFNGDVTDEYQGRDGVMYGDCDNFGETWRVGRKQPGCGKNAVPQIESVNGNSVVRHTRCSYNDPITLEKAKHECALLKHSSLKQCRTVVDEQPYYEYVYILDVKL